MSKFFTSIVLVLLVTLISRPLFSSLFFPVHDATHLTRIALMRESIDSGQFPPLWADRANNGYGYPLFHFYAPLFHLAATSLSYLTFGNTLLALKLTLLLSSLLGAAGLYLLARRQTSVQSRLPAYLATTAFLFSPYLAVNLYVRGAFSEYLALMLLPWLFLTWLRLSTPKSKLVAALVLAAFVLSHNLIPMLVLPLWFLWLIITQRQQLPSLILPLTLAFGLSAWFTLPLLFERNFTLAEEIAQTTDYQLHFVEPWQIWNSTWGFGGSAPGVEDGMSFKLGKLQLILAGLSTLLLLIGRRFARLVWALMTLFFLYLATPAATWLWQTLPLLPLVQFPWRALGPAAFALALLAAFALASLRFAPLRFLLGWSLVVALITLNLKYFAVNRYELTRDNLDVVAVVPEYRPRWLTSLPSTEAKSLPATVTGPATLELERAYYPTWRATLGQEPVTLRPSAKGLLELDIPAGEHSLTLWHSRTTLEYLGYLLTLLSLGYTLVIFLRRRK